MGEAITNATSTPWVNTAFIPVTVLVLGGIIAAMRTRRHWLVTAYVAWVVLYASTQSSDPLGNALSGLWYHDRHRVAAFLIVTSVMLATLGAVTACDRAARGRASRRPHARDSGPCAPTGASDQAHRQRARRRPGPRRLPVGERPQ